MLLYISSGNSTQEVCRALWHFYRYIQDRYDFDTLHVEQSTCKDTYKSILLQSEDNDLLALAGTMLWVAQSPFRVKHKRKNWYFSLTLYDESSPDIIDEHKIIYQSMKSPKKGGQHVNTTCSGVRALYPPLNIDVISYDERSFHQNKKIAYFRLLHKINEQAQVDKKNLQQSRWKESKEIERGNPRKTFKGENFKESF